MRLDRPNPASRYEISAKTIIAQFDPGDTIHWEGPAGRPRTSLRLCFRPKQLIGSCKMDVNHVNLVYNG